MIKISNKKHWLIEQAELNGNGSAIILQKNEFSYDEILTLVKKAVNYFLNIGVEKNNHVAIISDNNLEFILAVNALWFIGAIPIPLNPNLKKNELESLVKKSDCNFITVIGGLRDNEIDKQIEIIEFSTESINDYKSDAEIVSYDSSKICLMMFTSGSTGLPKCVKLTFNNLFYSAKSADLEIKHSVSDNWLASLPFFHIGGFSIITRSIISGCRLTLHLTLKSKDLISSIQKIRPTLISLVPTMFMKMAASFDKPWDELKIMFIGGGPVNPELLNIVKSSLWPVQIVYGATETSSMVTICSTSNLIENGISAGKPLDGVNITFAESESVINGTKGKIIIKSKSIALGYYNSINEESKQFEPGIYFSNDIGCFDENGNLQIIGRNDDVIISGGENISLYEITKLLSESKICSDCLAIGVKDEKWGQSYIIITDSKVINIENEINNFLSRKIAKFKMPKGIFRIEKIPRNELGKLKKGELQKLFSFDFL